jgi:hypothetical protein
LLFCGKSVAANITNVVIVHTKNTLTLENIPDKTMGDAPFQLTPITNSTGALTYTSSNTAVATITGNLVTLQGPGKTQITANQSKTLRFPAGSATTTLTIKGKSPTIITDGRFTNMVKTYGDAPFLLVQPNSSSNAPFTYSSSDTRVATINGNIVTIIGKGTATITATQPPSGSYIGGNVTAMLTVNPATPILSMDTINKIEGDKPFTLTLNKKSESTGLITYSSNNASVATVNGDQVTIKAPGTVIITATQAAAGNYVEGKTTTTLTIAPKLTVTWNLPLTFVSGSTVTSTSAANIAGKFSYSPAIVSYYTATGEAATQTITATFTPTSGNYQAVSKTWSVRIVPQTKTFAISGKDEAWTVPSGIQYIQVDAKGAGGGRGGFDEYVAGEGSEGGHVNGIVSVNATETLAIVVGQSGAGGETERRGSGGGAGGSTGAYAGTYTKSFRGGNGGNAGGSELTSSGGGGGGGGASAVLRGQTELVVAAGGGGGNGGARLNGVCNFSANAVGANLIASGYAGADGQTNSEDGGGGGGGGGGHRGGQGGAFVKDGNENDCIASARASGGENYLLGNSHLNSATGGGIGGGKEGVLEGGNGSVVITY